MNASGWMMHQSMEGVYYTKKEMLNQICTLVESIISGIFMDGEHMSLQVVTSMRGNSIMAREMGQVHKHGKIEKYTQDSGKTRIYMERGGSQGQMVHHMMETGLQATEEDMA